MTLINWLRKQLQRLLALFHRTPEKQASPLSSPKGIPFYTVYIPTLDGRFDYLSNQVYIPGEIVSIPFGPEDRELFGIVETVQSYPYGKTPLPMWKMKYILGKAPQAIIDEYHRLKKD